MAPHVYQALFLKRGGHSSTPIQGQTLTPFYPLEGTPPRVSAKSISFGSALNEHRLRIEDGIAVLPIQGVLLHRADPFDFMEAVTSYEAIEKSLKAVISSPDIKGILLDIDSPGGEVSGLFDLADFIYEVRDLKPIWAIANDTAYSAAYALASSAEKLYLSKTGGMGSIGVIATHLDQSAYNERKGFKVTTITAGNHKNDYSPHQPLSENAESALQAEVDRLYNMFVDAVSRNRGLSESQIRATEAGLFYGNDAVTQGLADGVQSFNQTLKQMQMHLSALSSPKTTLPRKDKLMPHSKKLNASLELDEKLQERADSDKRCEGASNKISDTHLLEPESLTSDLSHSKIAAQPLTSSKGMEIKQAAIESAEQRGFEAYRTQALEIVELCTLAHKPENIGTFLKQNTSVDAAREALLNQLAQSSQESIYAHTSPLGQSGQSNSWVVQEARARAGITEGK